MTLLDLKGLPAGERRPLIAEAVKTLKSGEMAMIVIAHEDFWPAIPKTIEGFSDQVKFESIILEDDYRIFNVLISKK